MSIASDLLVLSQDGRYHPVRIQHARHDRMYFKNNLIHIRHVLLDIIGKLASSCSWHPFLNASGNRNANAKKKTSFDEHAFHDSQIRSAISSSTTYNPIKDVGVN
jgi:hypothetical protein